MRLRCRFGIHKWGKYSQLWYMIQRYTDFGVEYKRNYPVYRSPKCECCGMEKRVKIETVTQIGDRLIGKTYPIWD